MELIKNTIQLGNSAGVLLPKEYLNSQVKIILEPLNVKEDIIKILINEKLLQDIKGIYLVGSYARKENTISSDVDVLIITSKTNKRIVKGKYELLLLSEETLKKQLKKNIFPILPMIMESEPIINARLIKDYKKTKLTKNNTKWHIETTKSAMKIVEESLKLSEELKIKESEATAYSLILRLREVYLLNSLKKGKIGTTKELKNLIKKLTNSLETYEGYLNVKNNKKLKENISISDVKILKDYILKKINEQEISMNNEA